MNNQQSTDSGHCEVCESIVLSQLSQWLRATRAKHNLSIRQLARMSGVSVPQIYSIERGATITPSESTRRSLADALGETPPVPDPRECGQWLNIGRQHNNISLHFEFGRWLCASRQEVGLSVPELAMKAGVSVEQIYRLERGSSRRPQLRTKRKIRAALRKLLPKDRSMADGKAWHWVGRCEPAGVVPEGSAHMGWSQNAVSSGSILVVK